jgi:hypothetical protein
MTGKRQLKRTTVLLFGFLFCWATVVQAAVPAQINYQGYLTDAVGNPVDGMVDMTFKIYSVDSGGTALWTETQLDVEVNNGIYQVQIGVVVALPYNIFDSDRYLGVAVETDPEMTPRQKLTSAAFAIKAQDTNTFGGLPTGSYIKQGEANSISSAMIQNGTISAADIGANAVAASEIATNAVGASEVIDNSLNAADLAPDSVGNSELAPNSVGSAEIINGAVTKDDMQDGAALAEILDDDGPGSLLNADLLDNLNSNAFMAAGTDLWVNTTGDSMTGNLQVQARISASNPSTNYAADFQQTGASNTTGGLFASTTNGKYGGYISNSGGYSGSGENYGLFVRNLNNSSSSLGHAYGIRSEVSDNNFSTYGGYFSSNAAANYGAFGLYAEAINNTSIGWTYGGRIISSSDTGRAYGLSSRAVTTDSASTSDVFGEYIDADHFGTSGAVYGSYADVSGSDQGHVYGFFSSSRKISSDTAGSAYGGYFTGDNDRSGGTSYGLYSRAIGSGGTNYGVYGYAGSGANNYGGYFYSAGGEGLYAITTASTRHAGYFNTNVGAGLAGAALYARSWNSSNGGIALWAQNAHTTSTDATAVFSNSGIGPLLKGFGGNGGEDEFRFDTMGH